MIVCLHRLLRPDLIHFALRRDGRDERVYAGEEVLFYRDGDGAEEQGISLVACPRRLSGRGIRTSHSLQRVIPCLELERPDIEFENRYYERVRCLRVVWDDGTITPKARINPGMQTIWLNRDFIKGLPVLWRIYVLFHEIAHLWTDSEVNTDVWASYLYVKAGYPPSQAAMCLKYSLSDTNPEKDERRAALIENLLKTGVSL